MPTGKQCDCGEHGDIVETITRISTGNNGILGPGFRNYLKLASLGIGCKKCGRQYGEPVFSSLLEDISLDLQREIEFRLSLSKIILTKKVGINDLALINRQKPNTRIKMEGKIGKTSVPLRIPHFADQVRPKSIPPELKALKPGDTLYLIPDESGQSSLAMNLGSLDDYVLVQLTLDMKATKFRLKPGKECWDYAA